MRVFSGIRPSGELHIGNYLGAIKQWIDLQDNNDCLFCIVDWHAITTPYNEKNMQDTIFDFACDYLAVGLDPKKCSFFVQSDVKEHAELAWLLGTIVPVGELQRMTQFKDKSKKHSTYVNAGLLNYPILMAADILLYQTDIVPIGKDQVQHLEFARNVAEKFNKKFGKTFKVPESLVPKDGATIKSLQNPDKKMSKTDDGKGCLFLFEEPEQIRKKIMAAETDSETKIKYDDKNKKGISNLLVIYSLFSGLALKDVEKKFTAAQYGEFKKALADLLIEKLTPFRERKEELKENRAFVEETLRCGAQNARTIAKETMEIVRQKMGLR
ncbi:MAG: tryptophan--tRNA ligase [Candidatus Pacebacteria bacterium]|nr:tryptophan--tRNA ligase [Candidatus Paceibacterota bacterium]